MTFDEILSQVQDLLQREQRVSYRGLKRRFDVDDEYLEDLKEELIGARRLAVDEDGRFLVWTGAAPVQSSTFQVPSPPQSLTPHTESPAERRQLTVMFCDLVGSTALSTQLDPEELRQIVRTYQETCTSIVQRYEGYVAQHLGDGLLVYFGYPAAHEDDAARAVRAGLEIIKALRQQVPSLLRGEGQGEGETLTPLQNTPHPSPLPQGARELSGTLSTGARGSSETLPRRERRLQVRIGIHTGLVVIGEIGSSTKREMLALGETPNLAARVQGTANPDEVIISATTYRLVEGLFDCEDRGQPELKGVATLLTLYRVVNESNAHSRFAVMVRQGLTPLIGREHELGLLRERWEQVKTGAGQVVLLSGEPGIGKSRLVQELKDQLAQDGATRIEFRCSPYHQNSALYPIIDHLQRLLQFTREDSPAIRLEKLQHTIARYRFPQADTAPLFAALLSLPHPEGYPPITVSPQKQKEKTQAALIAWLLEEAELHPVSTVWEDLHWADPSTLELLTFFLDQVPTTQLFALLTFRPEFIAPWGNRAHLSPVMLSRLESSQVKAMVENVAGDKTLPSEVLQQIVSKTDGVPLFVEELTKMVVETRGERGTGNGEQDEKLVGAQHAAPMPALGIPSTLQDALMARLDRLGPAKEIAQLGATIGREFSYELLHAVSNRDEGNLQHGLKQLVEAELLYQRGLPPQAHYLFKHALIQDTAYQSLLKSTRQQYHQQIVHVLEERFPDTKENQPELLAHHCTEANLIEQAIPYWQQAGEHASQRSAYVEAVSHLTRGLELLKTLPNTPERVQQELTLQLALSNTLMVVKGYTAPEVGKIILRVQELCQQLGETPQLFPALYRQWTFYFLLGELQTALKLAEQMLHLSQSLQNHYQLSLAHSALGWTLYQRGELTLARTHVEQTIALYDPQKHPLATVSHLDPRVDCLTYAVWALWLLGYPDQAFKRSNEAVALAERLSHPFSLVYAVGSAALLHSLRREEQRAQERAKAVITLAIEQGFPFWMAFGTMVQGWVLAEQGQVQEGIAKMHQMPAPFTFALLAEAYGKMGQTEKGLTVLAEALTMAEKTELRVSEAELYRMKGELLLAQAREQAAGNGQQGRVTDP